MADELESELCIRSGDTIVVGTVEIRIDRATAKRVRVSARALGSAHRPTTRYDAQTGRLHIDIFAP